MRSARAWIGVLAALVAPPACGGKVFVDLPGSTSSSSSSGGPSCTQQQFNCASVGDSCFCSGTCDEQFLEVECKQANQALFCTCSENGVAIAKCQAADPTVCDPLGCCAEAFFPWEE